MMNYKIGVPEILYIKKRNIEAALINIRKRYGQSRIFYEYKAAFTHPISKQEKNFVVLWINKTSKLSKELRITVSIYNLTAQS
jgi:hypothetical protein